MLKVDILAIYQTLEVKLPFVTEYDVSGALSTNGIYDEQLSFVENFYHEWELKVVKHLEMTVSFFFHSVHLVCQID